MTFEFGYFSFFEAPIENGIFRHPVLFATFGLFWPKRGNWAKRENENDDAIQNFACLFQAAAKCMIGSFLMCAFRKHLTPEKKFKVFPFFDREHICGRGPKNRYVVIVAVKLFLSGVTNICKEGLLRLTKIVWTFVGFWEGFSKQNWNILHRAKIVCFIKIRQGFSFASVSKVH